MIISRSKSRRREQDLERQEFDGQRLETADPRRRDHVEQEAGRGREIDLSRRSAVDHRRGELDRGGREINVGSRRSKGREAEGGGGREIDLGRHSTENRWNFDVKHRDEDKTRREGTSSRRDGESPNWDRREEAGSLQEGDSLRREGHSSRHSNRREGASSRRETESARKDVGDSKHQDKDNPPRREKETTAARREVEKVGIYISRRWRGWRGVDEQILRRRKRKKRNAYFS